ncbi:MAG: type III-A CRISPR-associated protein Csm2 [Chloroflexota bacterium]|nr:type III-A CRISPR-associated protein Csm2 [Chloroflexota bacterium]
MPNQRVQTVMMADESGAELVAFAQQTADALVNQNLTRSQIRTIFTEVRQIEAMWDKATGKSEAVRRLSMLKPKLAYQAARSNTVNLLRDVLSDAIDEVIKAPANNQDDRFARFVELFEAILAYHRAKGGRN